MTQTEIVENEDLPENSDRVDENGRVWDSCTILALKLDSGEEVQIVLRYSDPAAAIQALKGVTQDERLFKLAVGIGAIDGYEFVEDDDD